MHVKYTTEAFCIFDKILSILLNLKILQMQACVGLTAMKHYCKDVFITLPK